MGQTHRTLGLLLAVFGLLTAAVADESQNSAEVDEAMDNIVVVGEKSEAELRREMWTLEDNFYELYNDLNDESLYKVRCAREAETGSRIKTQVCRPEFLARAISDGKVTKVTNLDTSPIVGKNMKKFRQKVNDLITTHPELQAAAVAFGTARARYMASVESSGKNQ